LLLIAGFPVVDTWKFIGLSIGWLGLIYSIPKVGLDRLIFAVGVVLFVLVVKSFIPQANIAEGHNFFATMNDNEEVLEQGLPKKIFKDWQVKFNEIYTPNVKSDKLYTWKKTGVPEQLYVRSADSIFRKAKYSRQVDSIHFTSLGDFRGGFANEVKYNYWQGEMSRREMPFFVMYELTKESVGSKLSWQGQVFWEKKEGYFEEINYKNISEKEISVDDVGKRVYAVFFPKIDKSIYFKLEKSSKLQIYYFIEVCLTVLGWFFVLFFTVNIKRKSWLYSSGVFVCSYLIIVLLLSVQAGVLVENDYTPHGGGDDGLIHDGWGRMMALDMADGNIVEAMRGEEDVYWFTPGTRYFRMIEKLVYGDTNLGYMFVLALLPIVLFHIFKHLTSRYWATIVTVLFLMLPVGNLSYLSYVANGAKLGYGEAVGGFLFFIGLLLALKTQPRWGGKVNSLPLIVVCGAVLAGSMFIRPNFAFAVVWLGIAYSYISLLERNYASIVAISSGLALALWMPFHNWFYGGEFYLISKSGTSVTITISIMDYWYALSDIVSGNFNTDVVSVITNQLSGWLLDPGLVVHHYLFPVAWGLLMLKLFALIVMVWFVIKWIFKPSYQDEKLFIIGVASILALVPMLVIFNTHYRYAMLGWDLSLMMFLVFVVRFMQKNSYKLMPTL